MQPAAFARLTRMEHGFMLSIAAAVGIIAATGSIPQINFLLLAILPPFFIEISAFALNDYLDVKSDKINKRTDRPLVTGDATKTEAIAITFFGFLLGNLTAYFISPTAFAITLAFTLLSIAYNARLKDIALVGNAYIGLTMAIPFAYGAIIATNTLTSDIWMLSAIAFTVGLGRELMKTVQDMEGDRQARKANTLPFIIGERASILLACALYLLAIGFSKIPFFGAGGAYAYDLAYGIPILITDLLLLYIVIQSAAKGKSFLRSARKLSLIALGIGLLGFLAGALY
jgi:geranylgeranylglycerol-phosphate geranylgeranyltransferase